jgi:hypothetical protein
MNKPSTFQNIFQFFNWPKKIGNFIFHRGKFWKKPPSLNLFKNVKRYRPVVVCHEIVTAIIAAIGVWWGTTAATVIGIAITWGTIVKAILIVGCVLYSYSQSQKAKKTGQTRDFRDSGHLLNTTSQSEPIPIPYGTCRTGGNVVYKHCTGTDNAYYHRIITFGYGPVQGPKQDGQGDKIWLDDKRIQDFGSLAYWEFFYGTPTQEVCATLQAAHPEFDDAMRDIAYLYLRLEYNSDKFASEPQVTIEGEWRKLYDPRNGQTVFSPNNALVAYDFLRSDLYSIGLPAEVFDVDLIKDAANWCDANGYQFNGPIMERQSLLDNFEVILQNFRAGLPWSEGVYKLLVYEYDTPVMHLTEDDIEADSFKIIAPGIPETPNRVLITYIDAANNYVSKTKPIEDPQAVLIYDGEERDFEIDLKGTTNALQAEKLGSYYVDRNRLNLQFPIVAHPRTLALDPMDMIQITHSMPGWTEKIVRVLDVDLRQDGKVNLLVLAELSSLYDEDVDISTHNVYQTNLPDPLAPPPDVTNFAVTETTDKTGVSITFNLPPIVKTSLGSTFNRGDFTALNAFFWASLDLSPYHGTDLGSTPYRIEVIDGAGKKAIGYIGAVGAGLTYADLINGDLLNGNFETGNPPTGWGNSGLETYEKSGTQKHGGNYSAHFIDSIPNMGGFYTYPSVPTYVAGRLYYSSFWYYLISGVLHYRFQDGDNSFLTYGYGSVIGSWTNIERRYTSLVGGAGAYVSFLNASATVACECYIDDVSLQHITDPPATAVHIVSSLNGTVRDWASKESGFNPNTIVSWNIGPSEGTNWAKANIYISRDAGVTYQIIGIMYDAGPMIYRDVVVGSSYKFKAISLSLFDVASLSPPVVDITIVGVPAVGITSLTATAAFRNVFLNWTTVNDPSIFQTEIWRSSTNNRAAAVKIATVYGTAYTDLVDVYSTTKYYWARNKNPNGGYSAWYPVSDTAGVAATTALVNTSDIGTFAILASQLYTKIPIITGDSWTNNSPSAGYVAWNEHTLYYNGVAYTIAAGNTNLKYIYWLNGASSYTKSNINPTLTDADFVIAVNIDGYHDLAWNAMANQVIGSAYIQNASILNSKMGLLAVDTANIAFLAVDTLQIKGQAVTVPVAAYTAGSKALTAGVWTAVQQLFITTDGSPVFIMASGLFMVGNVWIDLCITREVYGVSTVLVWEADTIYTLGSGTLLSFNISDQPPAGSYHYYFWARSYVAESYAMNRSLMAQCIKK